MLDRLFQRHGMPGLFVAVAVAAVALTLLTQVVGQLARVRMLGVPWQREVPYLLIDLGLITVGSLIGLFASRDDIRALWSWSGTGRTTARAPDVWRVGITAPPRLVWRACLAIYPLAWIELALWINAFDQPAWTFIPLALIWGGFLVAGAAILILGLEFILRPAMQDVAALLPEDFEPSAPTLRLQAKSLLPVPGAVMYAVVLTAAFVDTSEDFTVRVTITLGLWLAIAVATGAIFVLLAHAALDPIDQLTEATRRVRGGDLTASVLPVTADELGTLARSFNQMLDRMRRHESELRESRARIVATADAERRRVERDLHDGAQQRLVLISLQVEMLAQLVGDNPEAAPLIEKLRADAQRAVDELRDLAHGIYPPLLESDGLAAALEDVADSAPISVDVASDGTGRYPSAVEAAVYFCCLEALQNAAKHAGNGSRVRIDLAEHDGQLRFTVADDGRGFDPAVANGRGGVQNMTDRIGALGGTVRITSAPDHGTTVKGVVPL